MTFYSVSILLHFLITFFLRLPFFIVVLFYFFMIYKNPLDLIGNTPIVELPQSVHGTSNKVLAKLEYFNTTHSMKDRIGYAMIKDAEQKGLLKKGMTIIEPTSGNTGVALALCKQCSWL